MLTKVFTLTILPTDSFFYKGMLDIIDKSNHLSLKHLSRDIEDVRSYLKENSHDVEFCIIDSRALQFETLHIPGFLAANPDLKLLIVGPENDIEKIESQMSGVHGYFTKDINEVDFLEALRSVRDGKEFVCNGFTSFTKKSRKKKRFTAREVQFINYCASDLSYKEIADRLFVSIRSIEGHRDRLFLKLNIKTRLGLVLYGLKHNIISI